MFKSLPPRWLNFWHKIWVRKSLILYYSANRTTLDLLITFIEKFHSSSYGKNSSVYYLVSCRTVDLDFYLLCVYSLCMVKILLLQSCKYFWCSLLNGVSYQYRSLKTFFFLLQMLKCIWFYFSGKRWIYVTQIQNATWYELCFQVTDLWKNLYFLIDNNGICFATKH